MSVRSIETAYAGCRFRSRLEARWAVFLDKAQVGWSYEFQGLVVRLGARSMPWLPDFQLETGQLAEVKGQLSPSEAEDLLWLATGVGGCGGDGQDVVVLGRVPKAGSALWPVQLHVHHGLWALPWDLHTGCPLAQHRSRIQLRGKVPVDMLLNGLLAGTPAWAEPALTVARRARFEHGESG